MPLKTCPKCNTKHGVRKLQCQCGHNFQCKRSRKAKAGKESLAGFPFPEPGEWIWDKPKWFPPIEPPGPLPKGLLDLETIQEQVRHEGLGFCVYSLIDHARIADKVLRTRWKAARLAMVEVVIFLEENK